MAALNDVPYSTNVWWRKYLVNSPSEVFGNSVNSCLLAFFLAHTIIVLAIDVMNVFITHMRERE